VFRTGATSYVIPDDILPNVRYLGSLVDDVELVLFETDEHGSNLPDGEVRRELADLAEEHGLSYTVHLPLDVLPGAPDGSECLTKAGRVIDATRDLEPFAYILHLDGRRFLESGKGGGPDAGELEAWRDGAARSLERVASWVGDPRLLCVENVEAWDPALYAPLLDRLSVSRTADVGHLWLRGEDGEAALRAWLPRTRVVHLHGIAARDHASLSCVSAELLDPVVRLLEDGFEGVVTLEVFDARDLDSSLEALEEARARLGDGEAYVL
jgi:sugar phosphate isomerase/epimerase